MIGTSKQVNNIRTLRLSCCGCRRTHASTLFTHPDASSPPHPTPRHASTPFQPRTTFPLPTHSTTLPRSSFPGHQATALSRMKSLLSTVDLVLELRDFRVPRTSRNPLLEESLLRVGDDSKDATETREKEESGGRSRIVLYTKVDLALPRSTQAAALELPKWNAILTQQEASRGADIMFIDLGKGSGGRLRRTGLVSTPRNLLERIRNIARRRNSLTGMTVLVCGMPNTGKSTLLNALRGLSQQRNEQRGKKGKVARTGAEPGVTRSVASGVKILEGWQVDGLAGPPPLPSKHATSEPVYLIDTPGVFVPYLPDAEAVVKLALCAAIKEGSVAMVTLADYLLYRVNLVDPGMLEGLVPGGRGYTPTNDIETFLKRVSRRLGILKGGGQPDLEGAAERVVRIWRRGGLGGLVLDRVEGDEEDEEAGKGLKQGAVSMNQARKVEVERRRERSRERARRTGLS